MVEALAHRCAGDHVLVMSNGGFGGVHEKLLARLARAAACGERMKNEQEELQLLLRSRFPIIVVETPEERASCSSIETSPTSRTCRSSPGPRCRAAPAVEARARAEHARAARRGAGPGEVAAERHLRVLRRDALSCTCPARIRAFREIAYDHNRTSAPLIFVGFKGDPRSRTAAHERRASDPPSSARRRCARW
jgi:hypothetical protein